jgi:hypothetical protein
MNAQQRSNECLSACLITKHRRDSDYIWQKWSKSTFRWLTAIYSYIYLIETKLQFRKNLEENFSNSPKLHVAAYTALPSSTALKVEAQKLCESFKPLDKKQECWATAPNRTVPGIAK